MMNRALPFCAAVIAMLSPAVAPTAHAEAARRIRAELCVVQLPVRKGLPLAFRWADPARCGDALTVARRLVAEGKGKLVANVITFGTGDAMVMSRTTDEVQFPVEYGQPNPRLLGPPRDGSNALGAPCTAFQQIDCGVSLWMSCDVLPGGQLLDIRADAQQKRFLRNDRIEYGVSQAGTKLFVEQPIFSSANVSRALRMKNGATVLLSAHLLPEAPGTLAIFLLSAKSSSPLDVQSAGNPPQWQVRFETETFLVPEKRALVLRARMRDMAGCEAGFQQLLRESSERGSGVSLSDLGIFSCANGYRTIHEPILQRQYVVELTLPSPPQTFTGVMSYPSISLQGPPLKFEMKNVGNILELEPIVAPDGQNIDLQISSDTVRWPHVVRWPAGRDEWKTTYYLYQPDLIAERSSTRLKLSNGERRMIAFHKLPEPDGRVEIQFLKTTTTELIEP